MTAKESEAAIRAGEASGQITARVSEDAAQHAAGDWRCYSARDLDEVDRAVCEGRVRRVVFDSLEQLMAGLWNGEIDADGWLGADVQIEITAPAAHDWPELSRALLASWSANARRNGRRRTVAGVILSAIAIAAACVLVWIAGR